MSENTLAELIRRENPLVVPGVGSPLEARIVEDIGFEAIYVSGYATAAVIHGLPDIGFIGLESVLSNVRSIAAASSVPLIVDADTGYGDVASVRLTVTQLEEAGASAIQLEDQIWPKKCGHLHDKSVISKEAMLRKLKAAIAARSKRETLIIARTDALGPHGIDDAIDRAVAYSKVGADATFIDAPESLEELRQIGANVPGVLIANMSETGRTPLLSAESLGKLGYGVILFPTTATRVASFASRRVLSELYRLGSTSAAVAEMDTLEDFNRLLGLDEIAQFEANILGKGLPGAT